MPPFPTVLGSVSRDQDDKWNPEEMSYDAHRLRGIPVLGGAFRYYDDWKRLLGDDTPIDFDTSQPPPTFDEAVQMAGEIGLPFDSSGLAGTVLKYGKAPLGEALKKFPTRKYRGKEVFRGSPQDLSVTKAKMPVQLGKMQSMAEEGVPAWDWYFSGGRAFGDWWHPRNVGFAIDNTALASPMTGVDLNSKYGANLMNQWA